LIAVGLILDLSMEVGLPLALKWFIDVAALGGRTEELVVAVAVMVAMAVVVALLDFARDYGVARVAAAVSAGWRAAVFEQLQRLSHDFHARHPTGDLLAHFTSQLAALERAVVEAPGLGLLPALSALASAVVLFLLDWRLAAVVAIGWPVAVVVPALLAPKATRAGTERRAGEGRLLSVVQENLQAQTLVKTFGLGRTAERARFSEANTGLRTRSARAGFLNALGERAGGATLLLLQILVLGIGGWMAGRHRLTVGSLAAFQAVLLNVANCLACLAQYYPSAVAAAGARRQIQGLLAEQPLVAEPAAARVVDRLTGRVEFQSVDFAYPGPVTPGEPRLALAEVSFAVSSGERVALVGASGSGKSTVLSLLLRFYDPRAGRILVDGQPLAELDLASYRRHLGVVFQESFLFNTSLRENIRLGRLDATDAEVEAAAAAAEIHDFIRGLPDGYDTVAGERGGALSGGERQRVAIARALVRDPALLLLDEATSALDPAAEAAIQTTLRRASAGRTMLMVTHRLSQAVECDRILVFRAGRLVEDGAHAALLGAGGLYADLWRKQSGVSVSLAGDRADLEPERLATIPVLHAVPAGLRGDVVRLFVNERHPPGQVICRVGEAGDRFYLIARGRLEVLHPRAGGGEVMVAVLEDGDCFGEIALLTHSPRSATVRTRTECILLSLGRGQFEQLMERFPEVREAVSALSRARLEELQR